MQHMQRIGVRELRQHASRYLAMVARGERVEVTDRGRPVAMLVPVQASYGTICSPVGARSGRWIRQTWPTKFRSIMAWL